MSTEVEGHEQPALRPGWDFAWVISLIGATFVSGMVLGEGALPVSGLVVLASATLMTTLWLTYAQRRTLVVWAVICVAASLASLAAVFADSEASRSAILVSVVGLAVVAPVAVARALLRQHVVDRQTVGGVIALYLMLGIFFAFAYAAIDNLSDPPFFVGVGDARLSDFLYFSYVTQTTVGYGDLVAALELGRAGAIVQALMGQLFLVTVVAFVVANVGRERLRRRSD